MPDHIQPLAVITGALSGIGRELAKLAAQKGYRLLLIARNMRALEVLSRDLRTETHLLALDLTAAGAVDQISSWLSDRAGDLHQQRGLRCLRSCVRHGRGDVEEDDQAQRHGAH